MSIFVPFGVNTAILPLMMERQSSSSRAAGIIHRHDGGIGRWIPVANLSKTGAQTSHASADMGYSYRSLAPLRLPIARFA